MRVCVCVQGAYVGNDDDDDEGVRRGRLFLFFSIYRYPISGSGNVYQRAGVQPPSRRKRERDR